MITENKSTKEIWKPIKGYEGLYEVSTLGRVKSLKRFSDKGYSIQERIPKLTYDKDGYLRTHLQKNGYRKTMRIHRLVADAFIPNPEFKPQVNHKNGIKDDNKLGNLEWSTHSENLKHAFATELKKPMKGVNHSNSKITEAGVRSIRANSKHFTQIKLAKYFGLSQQQVSDIINRKNWKHI